MEANVLSNATGAVAGWWNRLPMFWRAQIAGWGLFAILDLVNRWLTYGRLSVALGLTLAVAPCLVALSTLLRILYDRQLEDRRLTPRALGLVAVVSLLSSFIVVGVAFALRDTLGWRIPHWGFLEEFVVPLIHYFLALAGWSLCYFWIHAEIAEQAEHRRALRAETEALRLELEELRLQLDPHFLFNALNGVAEEIPEHPEAALSMLRNLTGYLRHSLDGIKQTVVTVDAEVGSIAAYLGVQKARFGERLRTHVHVEHTAGDRPIASFLLQPLVENAIKHGRRDKALDLHVDVHAAEDALEIAIANTGSLSAPNGRRRPGGGIGLANVRRRLDLHYPGRHSFTIADRDDKVVARLVLKGEPCSVS
ncbi:sensor histidine kinase [Reyranella sp.]|uniref:sensor histidine kinase n=1 Tax=Reyranella sp. TaxID=1929291 RepID=UPI003BAA5E0F